jgi:hypothetical protein
MVRSNACATSRAEEGHAFAVACRGAMGIAGAGGAHRPEVAPVVQRREGRSAATDAEGACCARSCTTAPRLQASYPRAEEAAAQRGPSEHEEKPEDEHDRADYRTDCLHSDGAGPLGRYVRSRRSCICEERSKRGNCRDAHQRADARGRRKGAETPTTHVCPAPLNDTALAARRKERQRLTPSPLQ